MPPIEAALKLTGPKSGTATPAHSPSKGHSSPARKLLSRGGVLEARIDRAAQAARDALATVAQLQDHVER